MEYTIKGRGGRGRETPRFDARLCADGRLVARLSSDGGGGCARVEWSDDAPRDGEARRAAAAWLASEALRLWPAEYEPPAPGAFDEPREAAILVVPAYLRRS